MQEMIENLVRLQTLELERARLDKEMSALPVEIARAEAALKAVQQQSAAAAAALQKEESLRAKLEKDIAAHRKKTAHFRDQLDSVTKTEQAAAIEHELQFSGAEIDRFENEAFASLERTEVEEAKLAQAHEQAALLAASLETVRASVAVSQAEIRAHIANLAQGRDEVRRLIEPELLQRFDRLVQGRGIAIARVEIQQCPACRMGVRPQVWIQLREGQLLNCDSCSRMLYWDPAMAAPPKDPEPAPVPGQGASIRKPAPPQP
jgi:hypothetical protein